MKIIKVTYGSSFLKELNKKESKNPWFKTDFKLFFKEFVDNPKNKKFRLHKLKWKLNEYLSVKIKYDLRLIFEYKKWEIILFDIWTHDEVY